jgi:DNA repair protein RadC
MPENRPPRASQPLPTTAESLPAPGPDPSSASAARVRAPVDLLRVLRPREKLFATGAASLSQAELLALVLGTGTRGEPVTRLAHRLVRRHGLAGLAGLDAAGWRAERGVGSAAAARLAAAFELGRRAFAREGADERPRVSRPLEVYELVRDLARARKEHLVGLYLDAQNGLIRRETISIGSLNTTRTHPREILYPAVVHLALGFILAHNHPSGCLDPSPEDVEFTRAVRRAGELMGIELYDHLIVARGGYVSLRERGLL